MSQSEDLKKLLKALENKIQTSESLDPWQELLSRRETVASSKSSQAVEVVQGFLGSWISSRGNEPVAKNIGSGDNSEWPSDIEVPRTVVETRLGKPGLPEINFVPYNYRMNQGGSKGPALIGHPISFSIVGPTLKDSETDWQWVAVDNSGTPGTGDTLTIDSINIYGVASVPATFTAAYNLAAVPEEGLYLYISATGGADGLISETGSRLVVSENNEGISKYEIFRVTNITGSVLTLDPNKRLADFFSFTPAVPNLIRAITVIKPYAARLATIPSGTPGTERTFAVVSPENAANSDLYPPMNYGSNSWNLRNGTTDTYGGEFALPIPVPSTTENGDSVLTGFLSPTGVPMVLGTMTIVDITLTGGAFDANDVGKIIHIKELRIEPSSDPAFPFTESNSVLGWYEILVADFDATWNNYITVRRIPEISPEGGGKYFGPGPSSFDASQVAIDFTIHEPVSSLFENSFLDLDALEACRLTNLINPEWAERSIKRNSGVEAGLSWSRADRAIFDTSSSGASLNANPGSLLDLGFRMVLFPAKLSGGLVVPDFDKPIESREVVIDPSINEKQYVDIDYSGGIVQLSHSPVSGGGIAPNGFFTTTNNPDGRAVLFASCVPYSMEKSQVGSGVRITGSSSDHRYSGEFHDTYSGKTVFDIVPSHTIAASAGTIDFITEDTNNLLPETGTVRVFEGNDFYAASVGDIGYTRKTTFVHGTYGTVTRLTGLYHGSSVSLPAVITEGIAVLRRLPEVSLVEDSTYGASARTKNFRFASSNVTTDSEGGVTVTYLDGLNPFRVGLSEEPYLGASGLVQALSDAAAIATVDNPQIVEVAAGTYGDAGTPMTLILSKWVTLRGAERQSPKAPTILNAWNNTPTTLWIETLEVSFADEGEWAAVSNLTLRPGTNWNGPPIFTHTGSVANNRAHAKLYLNNVSLLDEEANDPFGTTILVSASESTIIAENCTFATTNTGVDSVLISSSLATGSHLIMTQCLMLNPGASRYAVKTSLVGGYIEAYLYDCLWSGFVGSSGASTNVYVYGGRSLGVSASAFDIDTNGTLIVEGLSLDSSQDLINPGGTGSVEYTNLITTVADPGILKENVAAGARYSVGRNASRRMPFSIGTNIFDAGGDLRYDIYYSTYNTGLRTVSLVAGKVNNQFIRIMDLASTAGGVGKITITGLITADIIIEVDQGYADFIWYEASTLWVYTGGHLSDNLSDHILSYPSIAAALSDPYPPAVGKHFNIEVTKIPLPGVLVQTEDGRNVLAGNISIVATDGKYLYYEQDTVLYCVDPLNPTGEVWSLDIDVTQMLSIEADGGAVYVAMAPSAGKGLLALEPDTGSPLTNWPTAGVTLDGVEAGECVRSNGVHLAVVSLSSGPDTGYLEIYEARDYTVAPGTYTHVGGLLWSCAIDFDQTYIGGAIGGDGKHIRAFSTATNAILTPVWEIAVPLTGGTTPIITSMCADGTHVYAASAPYSNTVDVSVLCLNRLTGEIIWEAFAPGTGAALSCKCDDRLVYVSFVDGTWALDKSSGALVYSYPSIVGYIDIDGVDFWHSNATNKWLQSSCGGNMSKYFVRVSDTDEGRRPFYNLAIPAQ